MTPTDPLLTARESAAFLCISVPTFWRRVADGTLGGDAEKNGQDDDKRLELHR